MSRASLEQFSTIQDVDAHSSKSTSEIHINTNTTPNISLQLKVLTPVNTCSLAEKLPYQQETSSQSIESLKVPPFATLSLLLVIKELIPDAQELTPPLLVTLMTEAEPESDSHQEPEKLFQAFAELPLVLSLVEVETKSQS